jgi:6-phosphogluconolactonase
VARLTVVEDNGAMAAVAARRVSTLIEQSISARGSALVCLTGGRSVEPVYETLAADHGRSVDWTHVHLFWGDERHVPPDDPASNFGMAMRTLLAHVPIPESHIHRMQGELPDATAAAREYSATLAGAFRRAGRTDQTFDIMLLGLGEDAHIASLFPGSPLLGSDPIHAATQGIESGRERGRTPRVAALWVQHLRAWRMTLTPSALLDARAILVIVSGAAKAAAVRAALDLPEDIDRWPAQLLRSADERVEWMMDRAAARLSAVR